MQISVLVPTFNRANFLRACLVSLVTQSRPPDEILVIDDGSTDATRDVVSAFPDVRYLFKANGGKSTALNLGLLHARGDAIWIADDDDLACPGALEALSCALEANGADFSFGNYFAFRDDGKGGREFQDVKPLPLDHETGLLAALLEESFLHQFAMLVRKSAFDAAGPFRTDLLRSQDFEMNLRLVRDFRGVAMSDKLFLQRQHDGARGPASSRFNGRQRLEQWRRYDAMILKPFLEDLPLDRLVPRASRATAWAERSALIQRACILGRKALWDAALADLRCAAERGGSSPPTSAEIVLAKRMFLGAYGTEDLVEEPRHSIELLNIARMGSFASEIVSAATEALVFRARSSLVQLHPLIGIRFMGLLIAVQGWTAAARLTGKAALTKLAPSAPDSVAAE